MSQMFWWSVGFWLEYVLVLNSISALLADAKTMVDLWQVELEQNEEQWAVWDELRRDFRSLVAWSLIAFRLSWRCLFFMS